MYMAWLDFYGLEINKDDKNKIKNIRVLNTESSKEEDFVTFAALLRYFLNKNNFDKIGIEFTEFTNTLSRINDNDPLLIYTKTYQLSLKSVSHDHKRYLEIETLKCFFYADSDANKKEGYDIVKYKNYLNKEIVVDFKPQKKQVLEPKVQVWLEALNKYHV
jgi:hypothetical protein